MARRAEAARKAALIKQWLRPEVYPLFVYVGGAVGLAGFMLGRNLVTHPDVRVNKEDREAGLLQNFKEGRNYKEHRFRKYLAGRPTEAMPDINEWLGKFK